MSAGDERLPVPRDGDTARDSKSARATCRDEVDNWWILGGMTGCYLSISHPSPRAGWSVSRCHAIQYHHREEDEGFDKQRKRIPITTFSLDHAIDVGRR